MIIYKYTTTTLYQCGQIDFRENEFQEEVLKEFTWAITDW